MERPLVVFDDSDPSRELLEEAAELAAGTGARLTVLATMTAEEFAEQSHTLDMAGRAENTSYDDRAVLDGLRQRATEAAREHVGEDVDWEVVAARVGDSESEADRILESARANDADHVFLAGTKRSPTGKAVFGDRTQQVTLNFDGPVTSLLA